MSIKLPHADCPTCHGEGVEGDPSGEDNSPCQACDDSPQCDYCNRAIPEGHGSPGYRDGRPLCGDCFDHITGEVMLDPGE